MFPETFLLISYQIKKRIILKLINNNASNNDSVTVGWIQVYLILSYLNNNDNNGELYGCVVSMFASWHRVEVRFLPLLCVLGVCFFSLCFWGFLWVSWFPPQSKTCFVVSIVCECFDVNGAPVLCLKAPGIGSTFHETLCRICVGTHTHTGVHYTYMCLFGYKRKRQEEWKRESEVREQAKH